MKKMVALFMSAVTLLLMLSACGQSSDVKASPAASATPAASAKTESNGQVTVTDAKGRKVTINLPIKKYALSTMDAIDFVIPILGKDAFNMLVASGQDGGHGIQTYSKLYTPIVGNYMEHFSQISEHNAPFDLEKILSTKPDVLIVNSAMNAHSYALEIEDKLTKAGIPIILIDVPGNSITTSVQETETLLGQLFQKETRAAEVNAFLDKQYALIKSKNLSDKANKPSVYYEKSAYAESYGTSSSSASGWGAVIALAGGSNIADPILLKTASAKGGSSTVDPEYVIQSNPDFIILSGSGEGWMDNYEGSTQSLPKFDVVNRKGWSGLKAVKNNNIYVFAHASSRSIFGFYSSLKMASLFYPDEFKNVDADAAINEFFDKFMLTKSSVTGWSYRINGVS